jgi:hypothetical protein
MPFNQTLTNRLRDSPVPTTIANGTNTNCGKYYLVLPGDECAALSVQQGVALADFYFLKYVHIAI